MKTGAPSIPSHRKVTAPDRLEFRAYIDRGLRLFGITRRDLPRLHRRTKRLQSAPMRSKHERQKAAEAIRNSDHQWVRNVLRESHELTYDEARDLFTMMLRCPKIAAQHQKLLERAKGLDSELESASRGGDKVDGKLLLRVAVAQKEANEYGDRLRRWAMEGQTLKALTPKLSFGMLVAPESVAELAAAMTMHIVANTSVSVSRKDEIRAAIDTYLRYEGARLAQSFAVFYGQKFDDLYGVSLGSPSIVLNQMCWTMWPVDAERRVPLGENASSAS